MKYGKTLFKNRFKTPPAVVGENTNNGAQWEKNIHFG